MRQRQSEYMHWAKLHSSARFNLASSGVASFPLRDLGVAMDQLEINGDNPYGYAPLRLAIANKYGVDADSVVTATGTSMANHLAMAALIEPGDEVLMEHPGYELLTATASYLGAEIKRFTRHEENKYALDPAEVRRKLSPKTKLIVITNLHNPTSVLTPNSVLLDVGSIARRVGAHVLVDEVYLDAAYENTPQSACHLGGEFVVTSSLTKIYGLSGLRCGWILAEPALAQAMWRLNDLFVATAVHPSELLSVVAFQKLAEIRERARRIVEADRALLSKFLSQQTAISAVCTEFGTTSFLHLKKDGANADSFLDRLRTEYETSAVPGRFFGMPTHFRIGMGVDTAMFAEGLRRIALALET